ncbi:MAG: hypothetical protein RIN55_06505 [Tissierellaceae bacterium]|nr:hypothetical protein [Tissierellaceae bacterium]
MQLEKIQFSEDIPLLITIKSINRYPIHWHEDITEIILPLKGSVDIVTDFEKNTIDEGEFWFVNNSSIHRIESSTNSIVAFFYIDLEYFKDSFKYIKYMFFRSNPYSKGKIDQSNHIIDKDHKIRFRNILVSTLSNYQNYKKESVFPEEVRERLLNKLVYAMVYEFNWLQFIERKDSFISSVHLDRYHRIMKYVDEHYSEKITLDDIISMEYITKTYFSHFWKEISSFSFQERINYERVIKSVKMLFLDITITDISDRCGFSDPKYYYKNFKKWFGCMPLEFKSQCEEYTNKGYNYETMAFKDVDYIIEDYLKKYFEIYFNKDADSEATNIINHYANIRYLHLLDKDGDPKIPKYTNINILGEYCFDLNDDGFEFNWHNVDVLINLALDIDFIPNIVIDNSNVNPGYVLEAVTAFANRCIEYYGIKEVSNWNFYINYSNLLKYDDIDHISKELSSRIKDIKISYFFKY